MKFSFKVIICVSLLAVLLSACAKVDTGIKGKVVLGRCTGEQIATDCFEQGVYAGSLTIYDKDFNKIKSVKTKGNGSFLIALDPGTYFIHPENSGDFPMAADFKVVVTQGRLAEMTIYYDTGVR